MIVTVEFLESSEINNFLQNIETFVHVVLHGIFLDVYSILLNEIWPKFLILAIFAVCQYSLRLLGSKNLNKIILLHS